MVVAGHFGSEGESGEMADSPAAPIVVGVDGSPGSRAALRFALEEGAVRGVPVRLVTAWLLGPPMLDILPRKAHRAAADSARELQDSVLEDVVQSLPAGFELPALDRVVIQDVGGATLVDAARSGSMLVVGSGRKGALARSFLGSVSEFCVRHASVPVVVVPDPARTGEPSAVATQTVPTPA